MKAILIFCMIGAALAEIQPDGEDPTHGGIFSTDFPSQPTQRQTTRPVLPSQYIHIDDKQDEFDWNLARTILLRSSGRNTIISPLSVKTLLTIIAEAAGQDVKSETRTQLENALPYNKSLPAAREYFGRLLKSIKDEKSSDYTVNFETRLFADQDVHMNQKFLALAEYNYRASSKNLNFNDGRAAAKEINDWISFVTEERITDLVTESAVANSVVLMINAIYFDGTWAYAFNKTSTKKFSLTSKKQVDREFMHLNRTLYYTYSKKLSSRIVRLPYNGNKFSMFVILPFETNGIDKVAQILNHKDLSDEIKYLEETEVRLSLPKFKFDASTNLNEAVKELGITEIFENTATLPLLARGGTSEGKLKVSNIIQKSGIDVNEKGTSAWAATEIEIVNKFGGEPSDFIADHPFLFYIEDQTTGGKLFAGRVDDPVYASK